MEEQEINEPTLFEKVKFYVKTYPMQCITAIATVVTAFFMAKQTKHTEVLVKHANLERQGRQESVATVHQCIAEGRDFDYLPGLGVHVHAAKDTPPAE